MNYYKWLNGGDCCAPVGGCISSSGNPCDCDAILLELSKQHTDDLTLQDEIDYVSGITDTKLDASAYTPTDLSDYYTKEQVDALIPSGTSVTVDSELSLISINPVQNKVITGALNDKLDASAYTPVNLSNYATIATLEQNILNLQEQINSLIASISGCCGESGETQYRWITETGENDYWCSGTTKMSMEKQQSSEDGITWTDTGNERSGSTVLETNCADCGYEPEHRDTLIYQKYNGVNAKYSTCDQQAGRPYGNPGTIYWYMLSDSESSSVWYKGNLRKMYIGECCVAIGGVYSNINDVIQFGYAPNLEAIYCYPTTPPTIFINSGGNYQTFDNTNNCPIYVPSESINAYKTADGWSKYADRIQAIQ